MARLLEGHLELKFQNAWRLLIRLCVTFISIWLVDVFPLLTVHASSPFKITYIYAKNSEF